MPDSARLREVKIPHFSSIVGLRQLRKDCSFSLPSAMLPPLLPLRFTNLHARLAETEKNKANQAQDGRIAFAEESRESPEPPSHLGKSSSKLLQNDHKAVFINSVPTINCSLEVGKPAAAISYGYQVDDYF